MVEVVVYDAMMGSGKTQRLIREMKMNPKEKYMYVSPYLKEAHRIAGTYPVSEEDESPKYDINGRMIYDNESELSELRFKHPETKKGRGSKETSLMYLLEHKHNIVSTHALFLQLSVESVPQLSDYTLYIDECLSVYEEIETFNSKEVLKLMDIGILFLDEDGITLRFNAEKFGDAKDGVDFKTKTKDTSYEQLAMMCDLSQLLLIDGKTIVWEMSADMLRKFKKVVICTYLFEGQVFASYLKKQGINYRIDRFGLKGVDYKHLVNLCQNPALLSIGQDENSLSVSSYKSKGSIVPDELRKKMNTFFLSTKAKTNDRLFTCFKNYKNIIGDKRYNRNWLAYNTCATNDYAHISNVAYLVNVYPHPNFVKACRGKETEFDADIHSLGLMVQFIFRSRIRKCEPINLYIPSFRMRRLFMMFLDGEFDHKED